MEYLSVKQFAERFRVCETSVYGWIKKGAVQATRLGRTIRIDPSQFEDPEIRRMLNAKTQAPSESAE